ncbi:fimbrial biogenesis outer membrane usher protein [Enterobacter cloacae subsp. cloacae GS1]|nr:fimbrial biogenesis outer membrane usher protein [Enterobacter cloacae subsp. cloacae GS1]
MLLLSFSRAGMAEDYFDPAALELSSTEQKTADLHYFSRKGRADARHLARDAGD